SQRCRGARQDCLPANPYVGKPHLTGATGLVERNEGLDCKARRRALDRKESDSVEAARGSRLRLAGRRASAESRQHEIGGVCSIDKKLGAVEAKAVRPGVRSGLDADTVEAWLRALHERERRHRLPFRHAGEPGLLLGTAARV